MECGIVRCSTRLGSGLTRKNRQAWGILPGTDALAYLVRPPVTMEKGFITTYLGHPSTSQPN